MLTAATKPALGETGLSEVVYWLLINLRVRTPEGPAPPPAPPAHGLLRPPARRTGCRPPPRAAPLPAPAPRPAGKCSTRGVCGGGEGIASSLVCGVGISRTRQWKPRGFGNIGLCSAAAEQSAMLILPGAQQTCSQKSLVESCSLPQIVPMSSSQWFSLEIFPGGGRWKAWNVTKP